MGETWYCTFCSYKNSSKPGIQRHYEERHNIVVAGFFFCWLCKIMAPSRDGMWAHLTGSHEGQEGCLKNDLQRGLFRPKPQKRKVVVKALEEEASCSSSKRSRSASYSKELGPEPEFSVEAEDGNNNTKPMVLEDEEARCTPEPRTHQNQDDVLPETTAETTLESKPEEARETTERGTQTPRMDENFGWDHHHTTVREVRKNGTVVTTDDCIWRVGRGSVKFPCCDSAAEAREIETPESK